MGEDYTCNVLNHWLRPCSVKDGKKTGPGQSLTSDCRSMLKTAQDDGLLQERRNSIANALELRLSCTNISKIGIMHTVYVW